MVVVGGGTSGIAAAISSARTDVNTLVIKLGGSDQAKLLIFNYYHSKNTRFEPLELHFHAPN